MRILGVDIPDKERAEIGLTSIFGIGKTNVKKLLKASGVDGDKRVKGLTNEEVASIIRALEKFETEGDLRKKVSDNISRLKSIHCYRGVRHILSLPVHGQRTKTNARIRKGSKKTVGALSKETWSKIEAQQKAALKKEE